MCTIQVQDIPEPGTTDYNKKRHRYKKKTCIIKKDQNIQAVNNKEKKQQIIFFPLPQSSNKSDAQKRKQQVKIYKRYFQR